MDGIRLLTSRLRFGCAGVLIAVLSLGAACGQGAVPKVNVGPANSGYIRGLITDAETRLPVRLAEVNLVILPSPAKGGAGGGERGQSGEPRGGARMGSTVSGMDGSFSIMVPAGDYLVGAVKSGYLTPGAAAAMDFTLTEQQLQAVAGTLPQVHVAIGQTANVNLTLQRGAVIAGQMRYADGSPVIGALVIVELSDSVLRREQLHRPENQGKVVSPLQTALEDVSSLRGSRGTFSTDDAGRFRVSGLAPGSYVVSTLLPLDHGPGRVVLNDGNEAQTGERQHLYPELIPVYAPAAFRRKDAKVFEVRRDETIADADLTIDPAGLHTLRGRVLAASDSHAPTGMILIKEVGAHDTPRFVELDGDGSFEVNYLPSGSYVLEIDAGDNPPPTEPDVLRTEYKTLEMTAQILDGDVLLKDVLLFPLKAGERNPLPSLF